MQLGSQYAGVGAYFSNTRQKKLKSSISSKEMIRSKLISNLIGHFTSVSESMPTLTLLSLFRCLSYAAHRCQNPGIIPHFLLCPFYFSTENKTAFSWRCRQYRSVHWCLKMNILKMILQAPWLSWFYQTMLNLVTSICLTLLGAHKYWLSISHGTPSLI